MRSRKSWGVIERTFIDTSGWANLFVRSERYHVEVKTWFARTEKSPGVMVTSNLVLLELITLFDSPLRLPRLQALEYITAIESASYVQVVRVDAKTERAAWQLLRDRVDKQWSLVDATSFLIMSSLEITAALTNDRHFEQAGFMRLLKP